LHCIILILIFAYQFKTIVVMENYLDSGMTKSEYFIYMFGEEFMDSEDKGELKTYSNLDNEL